MMGVWRGARARAPPSSSRVMLGCDAPPDRGGTPSSQQMVTTWSPGRRRSGLRWGGGAVSRALFGAARRRQPAANTPASSRPRGGLVVVEVVGVVWVVQWTTAAVHACLDRTANRSLERGDDGPAIETARRRKRAPVRRVVAAPATFTRLPPTQRRSGSPRSFSCAIALCHAMPCRAVGRAVGGAARSTLSCSAGRPRAGRSRRRRTTSWRRPAARRSRRSRTGCSTPSWATFPRYGQGQPPRRSDRLTDRRTSRARIPLDATPVAPTTALEPKGRGAIRSSAPLLRRSNEDFK